MDRRQRKTREAIFKAFIDLLSVKSYNKITVAEIIDNADVGRATFYAHFETKDYLLKEMCTELFCHIFDETSKNKVIHHHIFECNAPESVFLHLFNHLLKNDNNILKLLSGKNNELFASYFKASLIDLVKAHISVTEYSESFNVPQDFIINHISSSFVETVKWWIDNGKKESPTEINEYFNAVIKI